MVMLPIIPKNLPSSTKTFINGAAPSALLRDVGDGKGGLLEPCSYGMQALHLFMLHQHGIMLTTTGRGRTLSQQTNLFLTRMTPTYDPLVNTTTSRVCVLDQTDIHPDLRPGKRWYLRKGFAPCAAPSTSNHGWWAADDIAEQLDSDPAPEGISARALNELVAVAHLFGWSWELQSEPWHLTWIGGDAIPPLAQKILHQFGVPYPGGPVMADTFQFADVRLFDSRDKAAQKVKGEKLLPVLDLPAGCVGLSVNVTVTETETPGWVAVYGDKFAKTSIQNWSAPGVTIANSKDVPLVNNAFKVLIGGEGAAHVIVDITGYWLG